MLSHSPCALPQPWIELNRGPAALHFPAPTLPSHLQPWLLYPPCSWWLWWADLWPRLGTATCAPTVGRTASSPCAAWPWSPMAQLRTYYTPIRMKVSKSCVPSCFETIYNGRSKLICTTSCCHPVMALASWLPGPWPWPSYSWPPLGVCSKALSHWLQTHWGAKHRAAWPQPLPLHSPPTPPLPRPPQPHRTICKRTLDLPQPPWDLLPGHDLLFF